MNREEAIGLVAEQVRTCEALGAEFLCCPEAVLGGLADYTRRPHVIAIDRANLRRRLAPTESV